MRLSVLRVPALILALASCDTADPPEVQRREVPDTLMSLGAPPAPVAATRSNAQIAADFMELSFQLESGTRLPVFTRFEGPITLRVTGRSAATLPGDLTRLLGRLRREAGIDIRQVAPSEPARITVELRSRAEIRRASGNAACFVVPEVGSWAEYRRQGGGPAWSSLATRDRMAIFLPADAAPQLIRDCLHEELAQALGPVNDLYRLDDSILNDDNLKTVLTGFDMLILKATYDPALASGMRPSEVAARLPAILNRINPAGRGGALAVPATADPAWNRTLERALDGDLSVAQRLRAAERAVADARRRGWPDNRLAFALLEVGRLSMGSNPTRAMQALTEAGRYYGQDISTAEQAAEVAEQVAVLMLRAGRPEAALALIDRHAPAARRGQNAALLATLLMIKAAALDELGRPADAEATRTESLAWARYGLGDEDRIERQLAQIARLSGPTEEGELR